MKYKNYNIMDNELILNSALIVIPNYKIPWPPSGRLNAKIDVD